MKDNHHRTCELCDQRAALYCPSDSAFLCLRCDSRVHGANFLVARHLRLPLCSSCHSLAAYPVSGNLNSHHHHHFLCMYCDDEHDDHDTCSSSLAFYSACVSTTDQSSATTYQKTDPPRATTTRRVIKRSAVTNSADVAFISWCRKLGLMSSDVNYVVASASEALGFCIARMPGVPMRVSMVAAFWIGVRGCGGERRRRRREVTWREVRRVEEITGVPVRMILAVDAKLRRELRVMRRGNKEAETEEGWAES